MNKAKHLGVKILSLLAALSLVLAACGPGAGQIPRRAPPGNTPVATDGGTAGRPQRRPPPRGQAHRDQSGQEAYNVGILQTVTHPGARLHPRGHQGRVRRCGLQRRRGCDVRLSQRRGRRADRAHLAQKFVSDKVDAIITIGTPGQPGGDGRHRRHQDIPVFFCAVADPYGAGLAGQERGRYRDPATRPSTPIM